MKLTREIRGIVVFACVSCFLISSAQARFEAGSLRFGGGLGMQTSAEGTVFSLGASAGVFVLKGFDVGISTLYQSGENIQSLFMVTGDFRYILFPDMPMTPYIATSVGMAFFEGFDNAWIVAPSLGALYMLGPRYGIDFGVAYQLFIFPGGNIEKDYAVQMGILFLF